MSTTPEELYTRKIAAEEYGEAILLAQHYRYRTSQCSIPVPQMFCCLTVEKKTIKIFFVFFSKYLKVNLILKTFLKGSDFGPLTHEESHYDLEMIAFRKPPTTYK